MYLESTYQKVGIINNSHTISVKEFPTFVKKSNEVLLFEFEVLI